MKNLSGSLTDTSHFTHLHFSCGSITVLRSVMNIVHHARRKAAISDLFWVCGDRAKFLCWTGWTKNRHSIRLQPAGIWPLYSDFFQEIFKNYTFSDEHVNIYKATACKKCTSFQLNFASTHRVLIWSMQIVVQTSLTIVLRWKTPIIRMNASIQSSALSLRQKNWQHLHLHN